MIGGCSSSPSSPQTTDPQRWDAELTNQDPSIDATEYFSLEENAHAVLGAQSNERGVIESQTALPDSSWTIILSKIDTSYPKLVEQTLEALRTDYPEIHVTEREGISYLAHGRYTDPRNPDARDDLRRIHNYTVKVGDRSAAVYASAFLAPPTTESLRGSNPAYDLRTVLKQFGPDAIYTLQIAIYGRNDNTPTTTEELATFRRAAEQTVVELRRDGEQAFYYHGPSRSTITIGVFGEDDHDSNTFPRYESPKLKAAREQHPLNLLNGQGITQILRNERGERVRKPQASFLVGIPEK